MKFSNKEKGEHLPKKKSPGTDRFTAESYEMLRKIQYFQIFQQHRLGRNTNKFTIMSYIAELQNYPRIHI